LPFEPDDGRPGVGAIGIAYDQTTRFGEQTTNKTGPDGKHFKTRRRAFGTRRRRAWATGRLPNEHPDEQQTQPTDGQTRRQQPGQLEPGRKKNPTLSQSRRRAQPPLGAAKKERKSNKKELKANSREATSQAKSEKAKAKKKNQKLQAKSKARGGRKSRAVG